MASILPELVGMLLGGPPVDFDAWGGRLGRRFPYSDGPALVGAVFRGTAMLRNTGKAR